VFKKSPRDPLLMHEITRLHSRLDKIDPSSDEYAKVATQLSKLYALKENPSSRRVPPEVWVTAGANLLGVLVIVGYERTNVITSKALQYVKLR
jgi:hypothetical protein